MSQGIKFSLGANKPLFQAQKHKLEDSDTGRGLKNTQQQTKLINQNSLQINLQGNAHQQQKPLYQPEKIFGEVGEDDQIIKNNNTVETQGVKRFNGLQSNIQPSKKILTNDMKKIEKPVVQKEQQQKQRKTVEEMDQYYKMLEDREKAKQQRQNLAEQGKQQEVLNETGCDRRRTFASVRDDGSRGHHMQDFIPDDELQKFMAKCKDAKAQAEAKIMEEKSKITSDNIGYKLLAKQGWKEGQGIGDKGIVNPIKASGSKAGDNLGLGTQAHGEVNESDDVYGQYRKRMMLGYKHRPNPLGNPRKNYY